MKTTPARTCAASGRSGCTSSRASTRGSPSSSAPSARSLAASAGAAGLARPRSRPRHITSFCLIGFAPRGIGVLIVRSAAVLQRTTRSSDASGVREVQVPPRLIARWSGHSCAGRHEARGRAAPKKHAARHCEGEPGRGVRRRGCRSVAESCRCGRRAPRPRIGCSQGAGNSPAGAHVLPLGCCTRRHRPAYPPRR